jgi:hypothetical protein
MQLLHANYDVLITFVFAFASCSVRALFIGAQASQSFTTLTICRAVDPFLKKEWYDIKAPSMFQQRQVGKTLITRTQGTKVRLQPFTKAKYVLMNSRIDYCGPQGCLLCCIAGATAWRDAAVHVRVTPNRVQCADRLRRIEGPCLRGFTS